MGPRAGAAATPGSESGRSGHDRPRPVPRADRPHLEVRVAGQRWGFSGTTLADARRVVRVPAQHGAERIALRMQIRHPLSPLAARYDGDPRPLGVALLGLALSFGSSASGSSSSARIL